MHFTATYATGLPALSWAAEIGPDLGVSAMCGPAVETDDHGLIAGAWAGDFGERGFATAVTSTGTALAVSAKQILLSAGTAGSAPLFFCRNKDHFIVSNSLAFALVAADDQLIRDNPYYVNDFCTYFFGANRYRHTLRTARGRLSVFYGSIEIGPDRKPHRARLQSPATFHDYENYREYLVEQTALVFKNAAAAGRRQTYEPIATVSSGYDSSASAIIAHEAGCRDGITFGEPSDKPNTPEDSGLAIGTAIGLSMSQYKTYAYKERDDLPEIEFVAASFSAGQVFLTGASSALSGRLMVSGLGGDWLWDPNNGRRRDRSVPFFIGGYSETEFLARAPALSLALPMIGARRMDDLDKISTSPAMHAWSVGGDYDRPIARRILEEAGIPRGSFADRKRRVAVDYYSLNRRFPNLDIYFSSASIAAFEAWFAGERPMSRWREIRHRLLADSVGRLIWSGKINRAVTRFGLRWPPFAHNVLRYKVPINKNCYVFNWAVERQTERYRRAIGRMR